MIPTDPAQLVIYPTGAGQPRKLEQGGLVALRDRRVLPRRQADPRLRPRGRSRGPLLRPGRRRAASRAPSPPRARRTGSCRPTALQVLVRESGGGQKLYPVDGGAPRPVPGATPDDAVVRWTPGRQVPARRSSLYSDVPLRVEKLDIATGRRETYQTARARRPGRRRPDLPDRAERRRQELRLQRPPPDVAPVPGVRSERKHEPDDSRGRHRASARTRSCRRSAPAGWARSTARDTRLERDGRGQGAAAAAVGVARRSRAAVRARGEDDLAAVAPAHLRALRRRQRGRDRVPRHGAARGRDARRIGSRKGPLPLEQTLRYGQRDRGRARQGAPAGDRAPGPEARQRDADEVGREAARLRPGEGDGAAGAVGRDVAADGDGQPART